MICRWCSQARRHGIVPMLFARAEKGPCICCGATHEARDLVVLEDWFNPQPDEEDVLWRAPGPAKKAKR